MASRGMFRLVDTDANITEDSTFGTTWRDTWKYRVPQHTHIILQKGDRFSLYAEDSADAEYIAPDGTNAGALVRIEARDPSEQNVTNIYGPANYVSSTEFQQVSKMAKLDLDEPVDVGPRSWIVFMTKDHTGMDSASVANSRCRLTTTKVVE